MVPEDFLELISERLAAIEKLAAGVRNTRTYGTDHAYAAALGSCQGQAGMIQVHLEAVKHFMAAIKAEAVAQ